MVFRLTWVASAALLGLVILRLTRLFLPTDGALPWQLVVLAAAALGAVITWAGLKARFGTVTLLAAHLLLFGLFAFLYVGGELSDRAVPPIGIAGDIVTEISDALTVFRFSSPPVTPLAGIVALAALMVWALSALAAWGLMNNAPYLGVVPPVVFYLQLAVIDRQSTSMVWTTVLLLLVGGGLASVAGDQRAGGGHAGHGRQAARVKAFAVPVLAVVSVTAVSVFATRQAVNAEAVPATGVLDWTNRSGIGGGVGSVSYNPFIDVQRRLVNNSDVPVFSARLTGDLPSNQIYWRLLTMDSFNGTNWYASRGDREDLDETGWEDDGFAYRGETVAVTQDIVIQRLAEDVLPAAYSPIELFSEKRLVAKTTRVDPVDGSLHIDGLTSLGMTYRVQSLIPVVDAGVLAADATGTALSPLFAAAADEGRFPPLPTPADPGDTPPDLERYLQLPGGIDPTGGLRRLALDLTFGLETDYEKALALEHYFRDPQQFRYSINVAPNERDSDLATWLLDDTVPGYHIGYCEQFSASMGVLARILNIPTRTVLGFTPGTTQPDGSILVRDRNAHAWVEVWLPAQGWVRFDPTPRGDGVNPTTFERTGLTSRDLGRYFDQIEAAARAAAGGSGTGGPPVVNPNLDDLSPFAGTGTSDPTDGGGFSLPSWATGAAVWGVIAVLGLGIVPAIKRRRRRRRLRRLEDGDVAAAWAEIVDRLIDSGIGLNRADTPNEVAAANDAALYPLANVYSESIYGPSRQLRAESRQMATTSLADTERRLRSRESLWQRLRRTYRLRSLLPDWIKRSRRA